MISTLFGYLHAFSLSKLEKALTKSAQFVQQDHYLTFQVCSIFHIFRLFNVCFFFWTDKTNSMGTIQSWQFSLFSHNMLRKLWFKTCFQTSGRGATQKSARLAAIAEVLVLLRNIDVGSGDSDDC